MSLDSYVNPQYLYELIISAHYLLQGQNNNLFVAYALRDWAYQMGLTLLPQTTEVLLASNVFVDSVPRIPINLLTPDRINLRGGVSLNVLIPRLKEAQAIATSATEDTAKASIAAAIDAAAKAIGDHPFVTDPTGVAQSLRPIVFRRTQFSFWSVVNQIIDSPYCQLSKDENLAQLANKLISAGHDTAVLTWISCLLRKDKIAALCCGGLMSPK